MKFIFNFDMSIIKELNSLGIKDFNSKVENRNLRAEQATSQEDKKKIKSEKIEKLVLDTDDLLILRFIYTIGKEPKTVRLKENNSFFWVKYDALFAEYDGLLFLSKTALNARLNKYETMGLLERKCIRNEEGTFSFFKLTGIEKLIYKSETKKEVKPVDSNGNAPLDNQIHISEVEKIIEATGATKEEATKELNITKSKDDIKNVVQYTIGTIRNKQADKTPANTTKENNSDMDKLESALLGYESFSDCELSEVLKVGNGNYTNNNKKRLA